jgi:hypothetical protein
MSREQRTGNREQRAKEEEGYGLETPLFLLSLLPVSSLNSYFFSKNFPAG